MPSSTDPFSSLTEFITTPEELENIGGHPLPQIAAKELPALDEICRDFISRSPFCFVASANPGGHIDISPKGDAAGFAKVLSPSLLAIPDRPGNRRLDTFHNLLKDQRVGLLFLLPGRGETIRIRGEGKLTRDPKLLKSFEVQSRSPKLALAVHVTSVFMHCPKCVFRSGLWQPEAWPDVTGLADMNEAMVKHAQIGLSPEEWFETLKQKGELDLW
ncbi:MSMEG_1061 family FMN-dependent PPOX-type flavoprotein [Labrenzia sp. PHM005]|uniref:MSMEG_1061 family FMN-dependent PPOX-type flavoprotein n=1 Tax=Labrenzia sp. PHM005 TaxID=2590016 RepID=UPI0011407882|nr:MSMEG_1061 family FMN-dependent PPOX-type flavoprotein [Labrenzia sp. PHM005]QDG75232.1 pyridoxamine 5'-phosphate oxidase family protein [Labrenzia sp. PHM005]